jgi:UDP-glucuronate decarboxylase
MKRILVTGGAGFIGRHLCRQLLNAHWSNYVICLDNNSTSKPWDLSKEHFIDTGRIELVYHDVCEPFHIEASQIFHCACPASPVQYKNNPVRTIETAVLGTRNVLKLARDAGARLLILSTSEIYGDPLVHPQPESYYGNVNTLGDRSMYDEGKRCGEAMASSWAKQYGTEVRIARLFNVYGPGMDTGDGRLIPNLIKALKESRPMPINGDGTQTRSWCYVSDAVDGLYNLMNSDNPKLGNPAVVNIGNPEEISIIDVAKAVFNYYKVGVLGGFLEPKFEYLPISEDDPKVRCPDISRAKELLGWSPSIDFKDGLRMMLETF